VRNKEQEMYDKEGTILIMPCHKKNCILKENLIFDILKRNGEEKGY
jgi:hypothetical protein